MYSKQSEKDYGRQASTAAWELVKPFSPLGANTLAESLPLIHDFAIAANILSAAPEHLILDLGAGACWCSEWLQRLNLRTVSVDISVDMLKVGRGRLLGSGPARVAAGDLERLPFASASFDRVVCLNALHHVPSADAVLREVSRVLRPAGLAVFSEPGTGHSDNPLSTAAMRDFGVLEQDIRISDFLRACHGAGFADVRIKPLSYMMAPLDLTPADWTAWQALARRRRPRRALQKIGRGVLEMLGLGKRGALFEEAVTMNVVRVLKGAIEDHPVLVAYKERALADTAIFAGAITLIDPPASVRSSGTMSFRVAVANTGNQIWHATPDGANYVRLGVQLLDRDMKLKNRDYHRESLAVSLAPDQRSVIRVDCPAPAEAGSYGFKIDLVRESLAWFETRGSKTATCRFDVRD